MERVQIRSFYWSVFPCIRTEYGDLWSTEIYGVNLRISPNTGKYGPEKTLYLVTFHASLYTNILQLQIILNPMHIQNCLFN